LISTPSDVAEAALELKRMELDHASDVPAIPGARQLLESSPEGSWAVVTSGNRGIATARMASAGLPPASILVTGEDVKNGKPFPDPYVLAAQRLQALPRRCAVFEDAIAGIASARAAGVQTIIGVGANARTPDVTLVVSDLTGVRFDGRELRIDTSTIVDG
jgi:mannitol-1-/sugar-/sorbitol-6-phosphatase